MTTIDEIRDNFEILDEWDDRYRYVIELGRTLEPMSEAEHSAANKVNGCVSQVWLAKHVERDNGVPILKYLGDSDAGLLVSVSAVELKRGDDVSWAGETITLPPDAVASLEVRHLAKGRTLLLASAGAGSLVVTTLAMSLLANSTAVQSGNGHVVKK